LTPLHVEPPGVRLSNPNPILRSRQIQDPELDLNALREESFASFNPNSQHGGNLTNEISGVKNLVEFRPKVKMGDKEQMDFIDFFAQKDGPMSQFRHTSSTSSPAN